MNTSRTQRSEKSGPFDLQRSAATGEGWGGTLPPHCTPVHASAASSTRVRRLAPIRAGPATVVRQYRSPPGPPHGPCWRPDRGGRPAGAQRGRALTRESCGTTLRSLARREESPQRARRRPSDPAHRGGRRPLLGEAQGGAKSRTRNRQERHSRFHPGAVAIRKAPGGGVLSGVGFLREAREKCLSTGHYLSQALDFIEIVSGLP